MGGKGSGRPPSEATIIARQKQDFSPVVDSFIIPNYSGVQEAALKTSAPLGSGSTSAAGNEGNVQYNASGALSGSDALYWNGRWLGIGTSAPLTPLTVNTAIYGFPAASGTSQPSGGLRIQSSGGSVVLDTGINSSSGSWLQVTHSGNLGLYYPLLLNPSGGNVGIGTTAPDKKLEINTGASDNGMRLSYNDADGSATNYTDLLTGADGDLTITTVDSDGAAGHIALMPDGNVGIGTTTPGAKLDVYVASGGGPGIRLMNSNVNEGWMWYPVTNGANTDMRLHEYNSGGDADRMIFQAGGNIGIGVAPLNKLSVSGDMDITGNVGIGTASPQTLLHLGDTSYTFAAGGLSFGDGDTGFYESADDTLIVKVGNSDRWRFFGNWIRGDTTNAPLIINQAATAITPTLLPSNQDTNTGIGWDGSDRGTLIAGGEEALRFQTVGGVSSVQVGTTSAQYKFEISGSCAFGDGVQDKVLIETDGDVNFVSGAGLHFGEVYSNTVDRIDSVSQNDYDQILFDTNGESNGNITPDSSNDHITVGVSGRYLVSYTWNGTAGSASKLNFHVAKNNMATSFNNTIGHILTVAGNNNVASTAIINLSGGDTVELWVQRTTTGSNIAIDTEAVNLNVTQIGGSP